MSEFIAPYDECRTERSASPGATLTLSTGVRTYEVQYEPHTATSTRHVRRTCSRHLRKSLQEITLIVNELINTLFEAGVPVYALTGYHLGRAERATMANEPFETTRAEKIEKDAAALGAFASSLGVPYETQMTVRAWAAFSAVLDHEEAEDVTAEIVPMMVLIIPLNDTPREDIHTNTPADVDGIGGVSGGLVL
jgi:hypothetical protein